MKVVVNNIKKQKRDLSGPREWLLEKLRRIQAKQVKKLQEQSDKPGKDSP